MQRDFYSGRLSLNKDKKSPFWFVTYETPDGRLRRRSTKVPWAGGFFEGTKITAKLAAKLAHQRAVQMACADEAELEAQNNITVREFFEAFTRRHASVVSLKTVQNARTAYAFFFAYLGRKADGPLRLITKGDIKGFVHSRREQVRAKTTRKDLAAISQAFRDAVDSEVIERNPCERVSVPPDQPGEKRLKEAFTLEEIRYIIDKFPPLWSSAVRCSFETFGQRLGDILALNWSQFDWEHRVVHFVTGKTGRVMSQPMRDSFYRWAREKWEEAGCPADALVHGPLLAIADRASWQFGLLLRQHGIGLLHGGCEGRRRVMNTKSFHSIRATCATLLQASGVSQGLAMELVGHDSGDVHSVYIRPSSEQLRVAASKLPEV